MKEVSSSLVAQHLGELSNLEKNNNKKIKTSITIQRDDVNDDDDNQLNFLLLFHFM